jgi:hypothetical protein
MVSSELPQAQVRGGVIYVSAVIDSPGVIKSPGGFQTHLHQVNLYSTFNQTDRNICG